MCDFLSCNNEYCIYLVHRLHTQPMSNLLQHIFKGQKESQPKEHYMAVMFTWKHDEHTNNEILFTPLKAVSIQKPLGILIGLSLLRHIHFWLLGNFYYLRHNIRTSAPTSVAACSLLTFHHAGCEIELTGEMSVRTSAAIAAGVCGGLFVAYCIYFDKKRRSDPAFKDKLRERKFSSDDRHLI